MFQCTIVYNKPEFSQHTKGLVAMLGTCAQAQGKLSAVNFNTERQKIYCLLYIGPRIGPCPSLRSLSRFQPTIPGLYIRHFGV